MQLDILFLSSLSLLSSSLGALLTDTDQAGVRAGVAQCTESRLLAGGHVGLGDGGDGVLWCDVEDGESGTDVLDTTGSGGLNLLWRRVKLLVLTSLAGEENQAALVGLETSDIGGQRLLGLVGAAVVDSDTDGGSELAGNTSFLLIEKKKRS